jgi:hypothetical protein
LAVKWIKKTAELSTYPIIRMDKLAINAEGCLAHRFFIFKLPVKYKSTQRQ